jgi:hypothetical protein
MNAVFQVVREVTLARKRRAEKRVKNARNIDIGIGIGIGVTAKE